MPKTIEEYLKQTAVMSPHLKASLAVIIGGNMILNKHQEYCKGFGITMQQYNLLRILRGAHPSPRTILQIKERMVDRQSDVSRMVDRLVSKAYVTRAQSSSDRRSVDVHITSEGLRLLDLVDPGMSRLSVLADLNDEEARLLSSLIERFVE